MNYFDDLSKKDGRKYPSKCCGDDVFMPAFEDVMREIDTMFRPMGMMMARAMPAIHGNYGVDVKDHGEEVIVVADMPGMDKGKVGIEVINPRVLHIFAERGDETKEEHEGYYRRERTFGSIDRVVPLPAEVNPDDATATLNNGVLEVRLKKISKEPSKRISIT